MRKNVVREISWRMTVLSVANLVIGMTILFPSVVLAQGQEASIIGQVTDESGGILPGVTVTATSPALQLPEVSTVTNERGEYRLSPLPIGAYDVTYTVAGFQTVKRENVRLTVGFTAKLDIALKIGSLEESVTVSGASPVIDVSSTKASTQLTREALELIPTTRNGITSVLAQAPGLRGVVDIGGSNFSAIPDYHGYGQDGEYWATLDGINVTNPNSGSAAGGYSDYTTFEETRVGGIAKGAEIPVRGASLEAVLKSGGNNFHGSGFFGGTTNQLQGDNLDSTLKRYGFEGSANQTQWDASLDLGGRIIRDKLWFYVAGRSRRLDLDIPGVYEVPEASDKQAVHLQAQEYRTEKISYQVNQQNRFIVMNQHGLKREGANDVTLTHPWESRTTSDVPTETKGLNYQLVRGNMVTAVTFGTNWWLANYFGHSPKQSTRDVVTLIDSGDSTNHSYYHIKQFQSSASVSWYKANGYLGNHEMKAGFDYLANCCGLSGKARGDAIAGIGDYQLQLQNGTPYQIVAYNDPTDPINKVRYLAPFVSDNWTIARRLTLNLGMRYERDAAFVAAQCHEAGEFTPASCIDRIDFRTWNGVAPRISGAYQLTGDGRTVLKGGYGLYDHKHLLSDVASANPYQQTSTTYRWHDLNGDRLYQPGEVNIDPNGPDFVTQAGTATAVPDPKQPLPREAQYFATLERELVRNFALRVTGVYSSYFNVPMRVYINRPGSVYTIPVTNLVPGLDGKTASGPGTTLTYYEYPSLYSGKQFELYTPTSNDSVPNQTFKTIEVAAAKRMSQGWQLIASYSATKKKIPLAENSFLIPNSFINAADDTWEWIARISGAYVFPHAITASANMENRSGTVGTTTARFTGGKTIPSIVLNIAPVGSASLPPIHDMDLRLEKAFKLPRGQKLTARLNLYNALNANAVTGRTTTQVGPTYLTPSTILPARIFEVAASYSF